jgi:hypothetical protein
LKCLKSRPVSAVFKRGLAVALRIGRKCDAPTQKAQNSKKILVRTVRQKVLQKF